MSDQLSQGVQILRDVLCPFATGMAARYGHPVYLVGSALSVVAYDEVWKLRDVDMVCVLPDEEFFNRFGGSWQATQGGLTASGRWAAEVGKMSRQASRQLSNMNVDLKIMSEDWQQVRHAGKPRLRIDRADFGKEGACLAQSW
jgi:hypothetical protein